MISMCVAVARPSQQRASMLSRRTLLPLLVLGALLAGCGNHEHGLAVRGAVQVEVDGTQTGFDFARETRLEDDRIAEPNGPIAGHCTIGDGGVGEPTIVSLGIRRTTTDSEPGAGMRAFELRLEEGTGQGSVKAELGIGTYEAQAGTDCTATLEYFDAQEHMAGASVDCVVRTADGATAHAIAELDFVGCTRL